MQKRSPAPLIMGNDEIRSMLERRLGRVHAQQRLGIESEHEAQIFGQGLNFASPLREQLLGSIDPNPV